MPQLPNPNIYIIDWSRLVRWLLPVRLRQSRTVAWLMALIAPVQSLYAAFIALVQKDLKYVIGYSSVSHMGYVLIGFAALNVTGINGAVANMFAHGVMSALFFAMIGSCLPSWSSPA